MQHIYKLLLSTVLVFSIQANANSIPNWFSTPPSDSQLWFYSVGTGTDQNAAKLNALQELSNRLQISIESKTQQFVEAANGNTDLYLETDSLLTSSQLTFTNIEIINSVSLNQNQLVLIKIDRQVFFQQIHDSLKLQLQSWLIDNRAIGLPNLAPAIVKLLHYAQSKQSIDKKLALLKSNLFDISTLDELLHQLTIRSQSISKSVGFKVMISNIDQQGNMEIKQTLTTKLQSLGLTSDKKQYQLMAVFSGINTSISNTPFHYAMNANAEVTYLLDDQLIYQHPISTVTFNQNEELANKQVIQSFLSQLGSH